MVEHRVSARDRAVRRVARALLWSASLGGKGRIERKEVFMSAHRRAQLAPVSALLLFAAACVGDTDPADQIAATSARVKSHGTCTTGTCDWYFEWTPCTRPFFDLLCEPYGVERRRQHTGVTVPSTSTQYPVNELLTGLSPRTHYRFRACAKGSSETEYRCGTEYDFVTGTASQPTSPMYDALAVDAAGAMSHPEGAHQGRDVGNAVVFRDRALYYFGDTAGPGYWRTSTAAYGQRTWFTGDFPPLADASRNSAHFDASGAPKQFIPYTATEPEFVWNEALDKNERYYHWPSASFVRATPTGEEGLVFFGRGGFNDGAHGAGMYVDTIRSGDTTTRAGSRRLLWPRGVADGYRPLDIEEGGQRYFIACKTYGFAARCFLARVPPAQATDAAAYRYYDQASGNWQATQVSLGCVRDGCPESVRGGLFDASPYMSYHPSITWNPYLGKYLSVAGTGGGVELRVADRITGPWSQPSSVPDTADGRYGFLTRTAAEGLDNYHAREHLHLRSPDTRTIVVSYLHAAEGNSPENRAVKLVKIELAR
jgi:hypothetical protein